MTRRTPRGRASGASLLASFALAAAAMLAGTGCTTVGNGRLATLEPATAQRWLVPGRTTRDDVRDALGQGTVIRFDSGNETWHYFYRAGLAKGWDDVPYVGLVTSQLDRPTKELVILFDASGTLRRYSLQEHVPGAHAL